MNDPELEQIRQQRLAQLQAQHGVSIDDISEVIMLFSGTPR